MRVRTDLGEFVNVDAESVLAQHFRSRNKAGGAVGFRRLILAAGREQAVDLGYRGVDFHVEDFLA
jgi:hypothetical protein